MPKHGTRAIAIACALLLVLTIGTAAAAQAPDTFVITWFDPFGKLPTRVYEFSSSGGLLRTIVTFPSHVNLGVMAMADDNQSFLLCGTVHGSGFVLGELKPGGTWSTLHQGAPFKWLCGVTRGSDGEWILMNSPSTSGLPPIEIYRLQGRQMSLLAKTKAHLQVIGGVAFDEESGQVLCKGVHYGTPRGCGYFRLDPFSGAVTFYHEIRNTLFNYYNLHYSAHDTLYDFSTNTALEIFGDNTIWGRTARVTPGQGITWLSRRWWGFQPIDIVKAGQRSRNTAAWVLCCASALPGGACQHWTITPIRPDGTWGKSSYLRGIPPFLSTKLLRVGSRHLSWHLVSPPNGRNLLLSFPGEGGRAYVTALSLAGIRPGVPLGDGRVVPINPDSLTQLSLQGGIPGVLENTCGILDGAGRALIKVDTNAFGSALKGTNLWAAALVLDSRAPGGIAWVAGPKILRIRL